MVSPAKERFDSVEEEKEHVVAYTSLPLVATPSRGRHKPISGQLVLARTTASSAANLGPNWSTLPLAAFWHVVSRAADLMPLPVRT